MLENEIENQFFGNNNSQSYDFFLYEALCLLAEVEYQQLKEFDADDYLSDAFVMYLIVN